MLKQLKAKASSFSEIPNLNLQSKEKLFRKSLVVREIARKKRRSV